MPMGSVSISVSPVPPRESAKKKRPNRLAKLKQCKLDVRREQWLSQVKAKEIKSESMEKGRSPPAVFEPTQLNESTEGKIRQMSLEPSSVHGRNLMYMLSSADCDVLGYEHSVSPSQSTSSSGSGNSSRCWSISSSENEEEDGDGCLDDWEAFADALTAPGPADTPRAEVEAIVTVVRKRVI